MRYYNSITELIGNTPVIKLNSLVKEGRANIFIKLESLNPSGSIKDRMALFMIEAAEKEGKIKKGSTIIEATGGGNTGLGVAMIAAARGYKALFVVPDKVSQEKIDMLKAYGSEVRVTRNDVDKDHPEHYCNVAKNLTASIPNSFFLNQYFNENNKLAHYFNTGPEIYTDMDGKIDYLVAGAGTGGTISGVGRYIKERNLIAKKSGKQVSDFKVVLADPEGSIFYDWYHGSSEKAVPYKVEGIGNDIHVGNLDHSVIDEIYKINDRESFDNARLLAKTEGIFAGGSTGAALSLAIKIADSVGEGKNILILATDSGDRYISKFYSDSWMNELNKNKKAEQTIILEVPELSIGDELVNEQADESIDGLLDDYGDIDIGLPSFILQK